MKGDWTREELERDYIGEMKVATIPVNANFDGKQMILDMGEVEAILRRARSIVQYECACRSRVGACIEPMDGCLGLNEEAERAAAEEGRAPITVEDALAALRRTHDAGLVHAAYTFKGEDDVGVICSCCSCCCHSLSAAVRFGYSDHVFSSRFISTHDTDSCTNCGVCVERCQFGARQSGDGVTVYHPDRCFGCGVCVRTCPTRAISLVERAPGSD